MLPVQAFRSDINELLRRGCVVIFPSITISRA